MKAQLPVTAFQTFVGVYVGLLAIVASLAQVFGLRPLTKPKPLKKPPSPNPKRRGDRKLPRAA
jgi:hypothetical protein